MFWDYVYRITFSFLIRIDQDWSITVVWFSLENILKSFHDLFLLIKETARIQESVRQKLNYKIKH